MDTSKFKAIAIVVLGAFFAVYLGVAAATAQFEAIAWVVGIAGLVFVLALGKHIWVLIPITIDLGGGINALPGGPPPWWIATILACTMLTLRFVMRSKDFIFRFTIMDFAIFLQVLAVGQAWIRHPAGFSIFGGASVGGKQNMHFLMAFIAYAILSTIKTDLVMVKRVTITRIALSVMTGFLAILTERFPNLGAMILPIWRGGTFTMGEASTGAAAQDLSASRFISGAGLGTS